MPLQMKESDEFNKLACPKCGCKSFHISMDGEEQRAAPGGTVNNIECDGCHTMFDARFVP